MVSVTSRLLIGCGLVLALGSALAAQQERPPLEDLLRETEKHMASQRESIDRAVNRGLQVFASKARTIGEAERADERAKLVDLGPAALPGLMKALQSSESARAVLDQVGLVLKEINDRSIVSDLRSLIGHKDPNRSGVAIGLLGAFKDRDSAPRIRTLALESKQPRVRAASIVSLAQLGDDEAHRAAKKALRAKEAIVRRSAASAFGEIGKVPDAALLAPLVIDEDSNVAIRALRSLGDISERTRNKNVVTHIHEALDSIDVKRVMVALEEIEKIDNKELSSKHLKRLIADRRDSEETEVRKRAAIALFRLGDSTGLKELAKPFLEAINENPRRAKNQWRALSELYWDFGAYSDCLKASEKYLSFDGGLLDLDPVRLRAARCSARLGKYSDAAKFLRKLTETDDWSDFADDESFREMRKRSNYRKNFSGD